VAELLDTVELEVGAAPRASVIWMHGLGADGNDFAPIVPELALPADLAIRFVFPHAPMRPVTINNGWVMRAWYDVRHDAGERPEDGPVRREDEPGVRQSQLAIEALIAREQARGIPVRSIALAGFSQGGAMALATGLRHGRRLAGIMALSCVLPLASALAAEASAVNRDVPIFMAHGTGDPVIPLARARQAREVLTGLGYAVEWREYRMAHSVCPEEIADISAWLGRVLGPRP
jgi:phospholipase/carboxylesterase